MLLSRCPVVGVLKAEARATTTISSRSCNALLKHQWATYDGMSRTTTGSYMQYSALHPRFLSSSAADSNIKALNAANDFAPSSSPPAYDLSVKPTTSAERQAYLHEANRTMETYHETRELMRQGKLPAKYNGKGDSHNKMAGGATQTTQLAIVGLFLLAFLSTPMIGRKIAQDDEFRQKYIPSWYDFTVKKPENPWTRDELHGRS
jgi:hypothetical protein